MFREVLRKVCVEELKHEVVGEAEDGPSAVQIVGRTAPDLVLLDLHLPGLDGFGVIEEIRKRFPNLRILVLSSHCDEYTVFRAERAYVQGFVDKNTNTVAKLKSAITTLDENKVWFSEAFLQTKNARINDPRSFDKLLTPRERDIVVLVGSAMSDAKIADQLRISVETVEKHRLTIIKKLELEATSDLVRYARDHGFTLSSSVGLGGSLLP